MPTILCPQKLDCPGTDNPFENLSSEEPDIPCYLAIYHFDYPAPIGVNAPSTHCVRFACLPTSLEDSRLEAMRLATHCVWDTWTVGGNPKGNPTGADDIVPTPVNPDDTIPPVFVSQFYSASSQCCVSCADGLQFCLTVPTGVFLGLNQAEANAAANGYACQQAAIRKVCLSRITSDWCGLEPYSSTIYATGLMVAKRFPRYNFWTVSSGSLPPGLSLFVDPFTPYACTITGTPTTPGIYHFHIRCTALNGDYMDKPYTLTIAGITNASPLPAGTAGAPYSVQLLQVGYSVPWFYVDSGTLPDGLTLDPDGLLHGTPTTNGTTVASVAVEETP